MVEEDWELLPNETRLERLDGLQERQAPPPPKTAQDILTQMRGLFTGQPLAVQYEFRQVMVEAQASAEAGNIPLMRYIIEQLDFRNRTTITPTEGEVFRDLFLSCFD
jgi:hypothetical protein